MSPLLEVAAITHPGKARPHNEDCIAADARAGLAVLADGMGGHNAGEIASRMAVELVTARVAEHLTREIPRDAAHAEALIAANVAIANSRLLEAAAMRTEYRGMGTTLVVAIWHGHGMTCAHVGDSRMYRLRNGVLHRLTRDHSIVQAQVDSGAITPEQARFAPNRNVLTRAVGIDPHVDAEVHTTAFQHGDLYLLCSDGLTDMLADDDIRHILAAAPDVNVAAERLVERANEHGGLDNISVIVVRVVGDDERGA